MSLENPASNPIDPEDREVVERLAKLQDMYNQISELRNLMPGKLITPMKMVLENPGRYPPEKLASFLRNAAQDGSRDIRKFKQDWHSDEIRELWQKVNSAEIFQREDSWTTDYVGMIKAESQQHQKTDGGDDKNGQTDFESTENILESAKTFQQQNPQLKVDISNDKDNITLIIEVTQMKFRVESVVNNTNRRDYSVDLVSDDKNTETSQLIIDNIKGELPGIHMAELLDLFASYSDFKTRLCDQCHRLFDQNLQLPLRRQKTKLPGENSKTTWRAIHQGCI